MNKDERLAWSIGYSKKVCGLGGARYSAAERAMSGMIVYASQDAVMRSAEEHCVKQKFAR